jgi:hypothetical protein
MSDRISIDDQALRDGDRRGVRGRFDIAPDKEEGRVLPALPQYQFGCRGPPQAYWRYGGGGVMQV